ASCQRTSMVVDPLDLRRIAVCLLEVVPDHLIAAVATFKAACGELMQVGALCFWDAAIRDVADEDMVEREDVLTRMDQRTLCELREAMLGSPRFFRRREVGELGARETATDDGRPAQDGELAGVEAVETTREQC